MSADLQLRAAAATDVGRVRSINEDSFLTLPELAIVADGMGGHACGDVASALAVASFADLAGRRPLRAADVVGAVARANGSILDEAEAHPEKAGMGTTVTGLALVDEGGSPHWLVLNVGDSRVYRITPGGAAQLTVDHSEVAEMVAAGRISTAQARVHPLRNIVTRSLGTEPPPAADTWLIPVSPDDLFVVCSDGLSGELDDEAIGDLVGRALAEEASLADVAHRLVAAAVDHGGRDNVTVIVVASPAGVESDTETTVVPRSPTEPAGETP